MKTATLCAFVGTILLALVQFIYLIEYFSLDITRFGIPQFLLNTTLLVGELLVSFFFYTLYKKQK